MVSGLCILFLVVAIIPRSSSSPFPEPSPLDELNININVGEGDNGKNYRQAASDYGYHKYGKKSKKGKNVTRRDGGFRWVNQWGDDVGRPFMVEGRSRTTISQKCSTTNLNNVESWKMGEAPLVQSSNPYNQEIGRYWLKQAEGEHASVASFARHTLQLMSIGAPSRLLVASQEASVDEIKHAKICYGFASAFIESDLGPGSLDVNGSLDSMDIKDIIRSLIIEGCIGETLAAIEQHLSAHNAEDTVVKAAISQIASDETKHAQLAWDTIKWIIEKYPDSRTFADDVFNVELQQRKTSAINESTILPATLCEDSEKNTSFRKYGLLVSADRNKVSEAGIRDIIEPHYRAGFKAVNMLSKQITQLDMATLAHQAGIQDIIEPTYHSTFNDVDMFSKHITDLDAVTL